MGRGDSLTFKWITGGDQLQCLRQVIQDQGWTPIPDSAVAYVAFDEAGKVAGFHILQLKPHAEPLYVRPDMEGTGLSGDLAGAMAQFLHDTQTDSFMAIADTPEAEKLCKSFGMTKVDSPVYIK